MVPANVPLADAICGPQRAGAVAPAHGPAVAPERTRIGYRHRARQRRVDGGVAGLQPVEADRPYRRPRSAAAGTGTAFHTGLAPGGAAGARASAGATTPTSAGGQGRIA